MRRPDSGDRIEPIPVPVPAQAAVTIIGNRVHVLVVDECLSCGIPVIAFDHGAIGDRLVDWGVGRLVPLRSDVSGLAISIIDCAAGNVEVPIEVRSSLPLPEDSAHQHMELYGSPNLQSRNATASGND